MKCLQVINVRFYNATSYYALNLAKSLSELKCKNKIICPQNTETHSKAIDLGLDIVTMDLNSKNPLKHIIVFFQLIFFLADYKPDIVNCHRGEAFIYFAILKYFFDYKLIRTRGDQRLPRNNFINRILYNKIADQVICTNSRMFKHILNIMRINKEKLHIILGGVDTKKFIYSKLARHIIRTSYAYKDDDFIIGIVGRFDYVKGQLEFLQVLKKIHTLGYTKIKLLLVGFTTDITQEEIEAEIRRHKLEKHVVITGLVNNITDYYSAIDLGVISSLYSETIARVAFECMSSKRALISTDIGVMPDLLSEDALIPVDKFDLFTDKIIYAYENKDFIRNLIKTQNKVINKLDFKYFAKNTLEIYLK